MQVVTVLCRVAFFAGALSGWIDHVQHQSEDAHWRRSGERASVRRGYMARPGWTYRNASGG